MVVEEAVAEDSDGAGDAYASRSCQSLTCRLKQGARLGEAQRRHAALVKVGLVDQSRSFQPGAARLVARACMYIQVYFVRYDPSKKEKLLCTVSCCPITIELE